MNELRPTFYTGEPDRDSLLEERADAAEARVIELTLDAVTHATLVQRLDAVGTMLGMMDPDECARLIERVIFGDADQKSIAVLRLRELASDQLYSDLEPAIATRVHRGMGERP